MTKNKRYPRGQHASDKLDSRTSKTFTREIFDLGTRIVYPIYEFPEIHSLLSLSNSLRGAVFVCVYIQIIVVVSSHYYCARACLRRTDRMHTRGFNRRSQLPKSYLRACFMRLISFYHMHETQIPMHRALSSTLLGKCFHVHSKEFFLRSQSYIVAVWISAHALLRRLEQTVRDASIVFSLFLECRAASFCRHTAITQMVKATRVYTSVINSLRNEKEFGSGAGISVTGVFDSRISDALHFNPNNTQVN